MKKGLHNKLKKIIIVNKNGSTFFLFFYKKNKNSLVNIKYFFL